MAAITITATAVRPLNGAIVRRWTAGAAGTVGQVVYQNGATGATPAIATSVAAAQAKGLVVGVNGQVGQTAFAAGDALDVVVFGPVAAGSGMTPGGLLYGSITAGAVDHTPPAVATQVPYVVGYAESATIIFVAPQSTLPVALSDD